MVTEGVIVGLDIGTTKVCAFIAERNAQGFLEITGVGSCPCDGLRKGAVKNIESVVKATITAIESAEMMSGREVFDCYTGIGGGHVDGINSRGVVAISEKKQGREIGLTDLARVIEAVRAVVIPMDRKVLEVVPQSYIVDDQKGIKDPLNMIGVRLEAEAHLVTCSVTGAQNLIRSLNRAGYHVNDLILKTQASGRAVLTQEEKNLGAVIIDLGGGTSDALVYIDGAPFANFSIPAGGFQVTNDISIMRSISFDTAEKIKTESGCCWEPLLEGDEEVIVPGVGGRPPQPIPRSRILAIIKPRMEEIFKMIRQKLDELRLSRPLGGGVVLTGGGALMPGVVELATWVLRIPARIGIPLHSPGLNGLVQEYRNPIYATAIGLMLEGNDRELKNGTAPGDSRPTVKAQSDLIGRLKTWLRNDFF